MPAADAGDTALCAAAREALGAWDLEPAGVALVSRTENLVFRVDTRKGASYALRMHRPGYHTLAELESEQQWTRALGRAGVGAPVPRATRAGRGFVEVTLPGSGEVRLVGVAEWVDGESLGSLICGDSTNPPLARHFAALGRLAARIHEQASAWRPPAEFERHALDEDGLMGESPFWGPFWESPALDAARSRRLLALRGRVHAVLRGLGKGPDRYGLIHADLHPANVLVDGDRLHVIDFDDAGYGWHCFELAAALHSYETHPRYRVMRDALLAGYREARPLPRGHARLVPLFLLARSLQLIGWIADRPEVDQEGDVPGLVARAERLAARVL